MSDDARTARDRLLARIGPLSPSDMETGTILVVPSLSFPESELRKIVGIEHYEERLLFFLLLLERPGLRIVYVTSGRVAPEVVDYYLSFVDAPDARDRLAMIALDDLAPRALSEKLLERDDVLGEVRTAAGEDACMLTFNVTPAELALEERLGVVLYGPHGDLAHLGSKSGARRAARAAGVAIPEGAEDLYSVEDVQREIDRLEARAAAPGAVIKLNEGFSGQGNAIVRFGEGGGPLESRSITFGASEETWASFAAKIRAGGAIVEELIPGSNPSPSVQMRLLPDGSYEVVSTHDQILGDPDAQVYLGCRFPAAEDHRAAISDCGRSVAKVLSESGVVGSFGIDFVIVPDGDVFLTEINLRLGGTTHPFLMARLATRGHLDESTGDLITPHGIRCYVATDNLKSAAYSSIEPRRLLDALHSEGLAFDRATGVGVLVHLLGALPRYGKVGATCVAPSPDAAEALLERFVALLDRLGRHG